MKVALAAYATVHDYPGSVAEIATGIQIGKQVLINKVNPQNTTHHLALDEAQRLMKFTGDMQIIYALADEMDGVFVPLPKNGGAQSIRVVTDIGKMSQKFGLLLNEVADDIEDGVISANELKRIQKDAADLREVLATLMSDITAIYEQSKHRGAKTGDPVGS